ncbi:MAG: hypothetical protein ACR2F2_04470 [Pyrinomonadaceae bacterium]
MFKILFLILIVMGSFAIAQMEEKPQAILFDEFEKATNGNVKMRMDSFFTELSNNPASQGYIINFGTGREIAKRERQIRDSINFRRYDATRVVIVNGGFRGVIKTEFWIVPAGAETPVIKDVSNKIDEFGTIANGDLKARLDNFFVELQNRPDKKGYILTKGSSKQMLSRERLIRNYIVMRKFDSSRIEFVNDGVSKKLNTELWIDL